MDRFHRDLVIESPESDDEDNSDFIEQELRRRSDLEDIFFQDLSPGKITHWNNRRQCNLQSLGRFHPRDLY